MRTIPHNPSTRRWPAAVAALLAIVLIQAIAQPLWAAPGDITRVSVDSNGVQGNNYNAAPSLSGDGRYVAFSSYASNLVSGDSNNATDTFVYERQTGTIERVSVDSSGAAGNVDSGHDSPSLSGDGRYVAFSSYASNLVSGDTNGKLDVFVHDRQTGTTERVSVVGIGVTGNDYSYNPSISDDGRYVAFTSDTGGPCCASIYELDPIYVYDRQTGVSEVVSVDSSGTPANGFSYYPSISGDGRYVAYGSYATNLVSGDTNNRNDIFVHDRQTGTTERVSVDSSGVQGNDYSWGTSISGDGRYVAFSSSASNLVSGDTNNTTDIFVHDRQTGTTERVSLDSSGNQANSGTDFLFSSISSDGRYVSFESSADNLVSGDTNNMTDVFIRDRQAGTTERISVDSSGVEANDYTYGHSMSNNGSYVAFSSNATNLVSGDTNGTVDVFVKERSAGSNGGSGTGPTLSVANANLDASSGSISVPVVFNSNGASIASVGFSLDYQESCLSYSSVSGLLAGFTDSISHDAADTDSELDISLFDDSNPIGVLSSGNLLTIVFTVKATCVTTDGTTTNVTVNFSSNPAASFGDPSANDVTGTATGGTLTLSFGANSAPTDIGLSPSSVDENAASGAAVGTLSTTDPSTGDSHTYTLMAGTGDADNASFAINGSTLETAAVFDFETQNSYTVRVRSTDSSGLSVEKTFTIAVNDIYEAPAGIDFSATGGGDDGNPNTLDINENKAAGASVATFAPGNPDTGSTYTFELVAGAGDTDNGSFTFVGNELQTTAPLDAEKPGGYTLRVRITDNLGNSFEQVFTITVNSVNEAPVAVDDAVDPRTTVLVGAASQNITVLANDSDPDAGNTLTVAALTQPAAGTATNQSSHISFSAPNANGTASFTYQATDGSLTSNAATVTVNHVKNDLRGDCNSSGSITAADFIATVLEIFDAGSDPQSGGNPAWWLIYAGGYAGSPVGCDANASQNGVSNSADSVNAADIICTVRVFFGDTSCTQPVVAVASALSSATLRTPQAQAAQAGASTDVGVTLETAGHAVAAAAFVLTLDPQTVSLDLTDADGDGVPDAVKVNAPASMSRSVSWDAATHRLQVALFGAALPLPTLADGALVTVTLNVAPTAPTGSIPLTLEQVSLSNTEGQDVTVNDVDGSLAIGGVTTSAVKVHLPFVMR